VALLVLLIGTTAMSVPYAIDQYLALAKRR
jgi:hypothetical protein